MNTKETNDVTSALVASIDTIAKARNSTGSLVVEARIKEVVDEGLGVYKVQYLDNSFEAQAPDSDIIYNIDDVVYIIVPNGNFDENKIILSHANPNKTIYATLENEDIYIPLGENLLTGAPSIDLCSYKTQTKTIDDSYLTGLLVLINDSLNDSRYFDLSCEIKTEIIKEQRNRGNYGLELTIPVIQDGVESTYSVVLDITSLKGDPYDYQVYSIQDKKFEIPENMEIDLGRIPTLTAFTKDFVLQDNSGVNDIFIRNIQLLPLLNKVDINTEGYYVYINASGGRSFYTGHYANKILTPTVYYKGKVTKVENYQCYWFKENASVGYNHTKYHRYGGIGWEILNDVNNIAVNSGGDTEVQYITNNYEYEIDGSSFLNNTTYKCVLVNGETIIQNTATIRIIGSPIILELISDKKDNTCIDNVGTVQLTMTYTDSRAIPIDGDIIVYCHWKRFDKYGNFIDDSSLETPIIATLISEENGVRIYQNSIILPVNEIDYSNTVYCSVTNYYSYWDTEDIPDIHDEILVGTKNLLVSTIKSVDYNITVSNGDRLFKYDANGNSPLVANYDGPMSSANPTILPLVLKAYKPGGEEFTEEEYSVSTVEWLVPIEKNSMITINRSQQGDIITNPGYYTIQGSYSTLSSLNYSIRNTFDRNRSDNTIITRIYFKDNVTSISTSITFLKEGESGTNGTKYAAVIHYIADWSDDDVPKETYAYEEKDIYGNENKIQLIYVKDMRRWYYYNPAKKILIRSGAVGSYHLLNFIVKFYTDGILDNHRTVEWSIVDEDINYGNMYSPITYDSSIFERGYAHFLLKYNNYQNPQWTNPTHIYTSIIQAKVTKTNDRGSSLTNSKETIYAYYPVETIYVEKLDYIKDMLPRMHGGYHQVIYSTDGTNPKFDSSKPFEIDNELNGVDISDLYEYHWNVSGNLNLDNSDDYGNIRDNIKPNTKYDNAYAKNYVQVGIFPKEDAQIIQEEKIQDYTEELQKDASILAYYDRLQNASAIFNSLRMNDLFNKSKEVNYFFTVKTELITIIIDMEKSLKELKQQVEENKGEDPILNNLYNEILLLQENIEDLKNKGLSLGQQNSFSDPVIQFFQNLDLDLYKISILENPNNILLYEVINNYIKLYDNIVEVSLSTQINKIDNQFITEEIKFCVQIITPINNFISDNRWSILINDYPLEEE